MNEVVLPIKFQVNDNLELILSDSALEHILIGDIGERLVMQDNKRTGEVETILKGGMHTVDGFLTFKQLHEPNKLEHLLFLTRIETNTGTMQESYKMELLT